MKKYFISYYFVTDTMWGMGYCSAVRAKPISSVEDTQDIVANIKANDPKYRDVVILFWRLFEKPETV